MGIQIISPKPTDEEMTRLHAGDVVIIPAFGTEVGTRKKLEAKGCQLVDTTCGDVMSVWKRVRQYRRKASPASSTARPSTRKPRPRLRRRAPRQRPLSRRLHAGGDRLRLQLHPATAATSGVLEKFKGAYSDGFDPDVHLQAVGVANQTTMLRGETEEVQRRFKTAMIQKYGAGEIDKHFRFFDTICGATQDRQDALEKLLREPMDLLLVIGGYNSSNTSHLAEMGEAKLPTYFIKNAAKMVSDKVIRPLRPAQTGSRNARLAAAGQDHRRHHRRRVLPEQSDRGHHPPPVRIARHFRAANCWRISPRCGFRVRIPRSHASHAPGTRTDSNAATSRPTRNSAPTPAAANIRNRRPNGAPNISATATASSIRAPFAGWNTRPRFFSTAPAIICARA